MVGLTDRQALVLAAVETYYLRYGYGPSMRKLAIDLGYAAVSTAHQHVKALKRKGRVKWGGRLGYIPVRRLGEERAA